MQKFSLLFNMSTANNTANKPQVVSGPSEATGTVLTATSQKLTDGQASTTTKAINPSGIKLISGGIELEDGFFEASLKAFTNLFSYHPVALVLAIVGTLYLLSHLSGKNLTHSPFHLMHATITKTHNTTTTNVGKSATAFFMGIAFVLKKYEQFFATMAIFFFPYFCKPSKRNAVISMFLVIYTLLSGISAVSMLTLAYAYFLLSALRSPVHKSILMIIALVSVILGHELITELAK